MVNLVIRSEFISFNYLPRFSIHRQGMGKVSVTDEE